MYVFKIIGEVLGILLTIFTLYKWRNAIYYYFCQRHYRFGRRQMAQINKSYDIVIPLIKSHLDFSYLMWNKLKSDAKKQAGVTD